MKTKDEQTVKEKCEQNLRLILAAAWHYKSEHNLSIDVIIEPKALQCFKDFGNLCCPLGKNDYEAFIYSEGPRCPNMPEEHFLPKPIAVKIKTV